MKTMKTITATHSASSTRMTKGEIAPVRPSSSICTRACGSEATMPVKMISEMPLPTPRAVICSPSHIRNMVPPTMVTTVVKRKYQPGSTTAAPTEPLHALEPDRQP